MRQITKLFTLAFLVFYSLASIAITNIESQRLKNVEDGLSGNVSLSLDGRIGANDKIALGTGLKLIKAHKDYEIIALISRDYAEVNEQVNTDESLIHLRYLNKHSNNWGSEVFTQHQEDRFNPLTKRSLLGLGARYTLDPSADKQAEQTQANHLGFGVFYEEESYINSMLDPNQENIRANLYWAFKNKIAKNTLYTSTLYLQPKLEVLDDVKGIWQNALSISVTSTISLRLTWDLEHDTQSATDANETETSYNSVLIYNF